MFRSEGTSKRVQSFRGIKLSRLECIDLPYSVLHCIHGSKVWKHLYKFLSTSLQKITRSTFYQRTKMYFLVANKNLLRFFKVEDLMGVGQFLNVLCKVQSNDTYVLVFKVYILTEVDECRKLKVFLSIQYEMAAYQS